MSVEQPWVQHRAPPPTPATPEPAETRQVQAIPDPGHRRASSCQRAGGGLRPPEM